MNAFVTNLWGVVFGINLAILMKVIGDDLFAFISFIMPQFLLFLQLCRFTDASCVLNFVKAKSCVGEKGDEELGTFFRIWSTSYVLPVHEFFNNFVIYVK